MRSTLRVGRGVIRGFSRRLGRPCLRSIGTLLPWRRSSTCRLSKFFCVILNAASRRYWINALMSSSLQITCIDRISLR